MLKRISVSSSFMTRRKSSDCAIIEASYSEVIIVSKLQQVQEWTAQQHADFAYISDPRTIQYLTGFYSDPIERVLALIVFPDQEPFMFAPALEVEAIKETGFTYPVYGYLDHENPWKMIATNALSRVNQPKSIALEKGQLAVDRLENLQTVFPTAKFDLDITDFINSLRVIKTPDEIEKLRIAGKWADFAFEKGFAAVKAGRTEQQVVAELQYALMKEGIMQMSFDTLVQAGAHAAEHTVPLTPLSSKKTNSFCLTSGLSGMVTFQTLLGPLR